MPTVAWQKTKNPTMPPYRHVQWSDFENTPFCKEKYDDTTPGANPDVVANKSPSTFSTTCTLPNRQGRHVIYGEWGRNYFTFERFHGCIDLQFSGTAPGNTSGGSQNGSPGSSSVIGMMPPLVEMLLND